MDQSRETGAITAILDFDYGQVSTSTAAAAEQAAARIQNCLRQCRRNYFEIGRELLWVKGELGHGKFVRWIETKFTLTLRTAENYMALSLALGDITETISYLPATTLFELARPSTPERVRDEIRARLSRKERPSAGDVNSLIISGRLDQKAINRVYRGKRRRAYARRREREAQNRREHNKSRRHWAANSILKLGSADVQTVLNYLRQAEPRDRELVSLLERGLRAGASNAA